MCEGCTNSTCRKHGCQGGRKALRAKINERFSESLKYLAQGKAQPVGE